MPPTIALSPSRYSAQLPAHRFRQGNRDVYYFTLDLATLDGLLPQRIDNTVVREANRRLTPSHHRDIQQYLEDRPDWLLGALLLGIAPDALEFEPYQDQDGNEYSPNFGELSVITNRANTMRIFDGQHRRRAIQDTLDRLGNAEDKIDKLTDLAGIVSSDSPLRGGRHRGAPSDVHRRFKNQAHRGQRGGPVRQA